MPHSTRGLLSSGRKCHILEEVFSIVKGSATSYRESGQLWKEIPHTTGILFTSGRKEVPHSAGSLVH